LSPKVLAFAAVAAVAALFLQRSDRPSPYRDSLTSESAFVDGCWLNPATQRWEPPAPWNPDYRVAEKAGLLRRVPRSRLAASGSGRRR